MKKLQAVLVLSFVAIGAGYPAWAGKTFTFASGTTEGYIDDPARWSGDSGADRHCASSGTILVTNAWSVSGSYFDFGASDAAKPTVLKVLSGGSVSTLQGLRPGWSSGKYGNVVVESGGTLQGGGWSVGASGYGIVTNSGALKVSGHLTLGGEKAATGEGIWVHNTATDNVFTNPKDLYVGVLGRGELIVNDGYEFWWRYYSHNGNGDVIVGQSQQDNKIVLNPGSSFRAGYVYFGGKPSGTAGHGELVMRGGTYYNDIDNLAHKEQIWLGACSASGGVISEQSYGRIRGWGRLTGKTSSFFSERGICIRMGHGEMLGDGEGDESHILDCYNGVWQITNVVFGAATTSGWRAVNKGAVRYPPYPTYDGYALSFTSCAGCDASLQKPNLVNAVRVSANGLKAGSMKVLGVDCLAFDRSDAFTNALPAGANVLGVWRLGMFNSATARADSNVSSVSKASVSFRYDQTKILKPDTVLELYRYSKTDGKWARLNRLAAKDRTDDCLISTESAVAKVDETFNIGTFAVVEREAKGMLILFR